jgi:hypothetical protein
VNGWREQLEKTTDNRVLAYSERFLARQSSEFHLLREAGAKEA